MLKNPRAYDLEIFQSAGWWCHSFSFLKSFFAFALTALLFHLQSLGHPFYYYFYVNYLNVFLPFINGAAL